MQWALGCFLGVIMGHYLIWPYDLIGSAGAVIFVFFMQYVFISENKTWNKK